MRKFPIHYYAKLMWIWKTYSRYFHFRFYTYTGWRFFDNFWWPLLRSFRGM